MKTCKYCNVEFKRGENNNKVNPELESKIINVDTNQELNIDSYDYSDGNPFWNLLTEKVDFKNYNEIARKIVTKYNFGKDIYKAEKICKWLFSRAVKATK